MPSRITHILNGESLINDASGLVAFKFAVAAVATGVFSWIDAAEQVVCCRGGGLLAGLAVAWIIGEVRVRLARYCVNDPTIQTTFSILTPFAAYLAAEALRSRASCRSWPPDCTRACTIRGTSTRRRASTRGKSGRCCSSCSTASCSCCSACSCAPC